MTPGLAALAPATATPRLFLPGAYLPRADGSRRRCRRARRCPCSAACSASPATPSSPATCARTRTSPSPRPTRCLRASTTASSPRCRARSPTTRVPDRAPRRRRRAAVHHLRRVPSGARRQALVVSRLRPSCERRDQNEFAVVGYRAHSMVHGELEPSAPAGTLHARPSSRLSRTTASRSSTRTVAVVLVVPLNLAFGNPGLLQRDRTRSRADRDRQRARSTRTTSRSTTSCAACSSRFRARACDPPRAWMVRRCPTASPA